MKEERPALACLLYTRNKKFRHQEHQEHQEHHKNETNLKALGKRHR
jgi:hypothetical protein